MITAITPFPTPIPSRSNPAQWAENYETNFLDKLNPFITELNAFGVDLQALATAMTLNDTTTTSSSSNTIEIGDKTFAVDSGKSFQIGMTLIAAYNSENFIAGNVKSYSGTTLIITATVASFSISSGPYASWTISLSGPVAGVVVLSPSVALGVI